jgi:hypothetical protein
VTFFTAKKTNPPNPKNKNNSQVKKRQQKWLFLEKIPVE